MCTEPKALRNRQNCLCIKQRRHRWELFDFIWRRLRSAVGALTCLIPLLGGNPCRLSNAVSLGYQGHADFCLVVVTGRPITNS